MNEKHLVLGASGAIGSAVVKELQKRGLNFRVTGISDKDAVVKTPRIDLLNKKAAEKAITGSDYVYLCVGLPYDSKYWEENWPKLMQNVVDACTKTGSKLIFLDNAYMYGAPLPMPFDEETKQTTNTRKGLARKKTAEILMQAIKNNKIKGLIGRSPDFYGPKSINSIFYITFLKNMLSGKNPQWLTDPSKKHSYAYSEDIGRALVSLALDKDCYGKVWHLPVEKPINACEMLENFNETLGTNKKISVIPKIILLILSIFIKPLKETKEMSYQFENDYIFSDKKFRNHFPNFTTTPYKEGIKNMINSFKDKK